MDWNRVEGSQVEQPDEIEISEKLVYVRKNIDTITKTDEQGREYTHFVYDEVQIPKEDVGNIVKATSELYEDKISANSDAIDELLIAILEG